MRAAAAALAAAAVLARAAAAAGVPGAWPCAAAPTSVPVRDVAWKMQRGCGLGDRLLDLWAFGLMAKARARALAAARSASGDGAAVAHARARFETVWPCGTDWDGQNLAFCYDPTLLVLPAEVAVSLATATQTHDDAYDGFRHDGTATCDFVPDRDIPTDPFWGFRDTGMRFHRFATVPPERLRTPAFVDAIANAAAAQASGEYASARERARKAYLAVMTDLNFRAFARATAPPGPAVQPRVRSAVCVHVRASDKALHHGAKRLLRTAIDDAAARAAQLLRFRTREVPIFTEDVTWWDAARNALAQHGVLVSARGAPGSQRAGSLEDGAQAVEEFFALSECRVILSACPGWSTFVLAAALAGPVRTQVELFGLVDARGPDGARAVESLLADGGRASDLFYVRKFAAWKSAVGGARLRAHIRDANGSIAIV